MTKALSNILTLGLLMTIFSCSTTKTVTTTDGVPNPKINRDNYYDFYSASGLTPVTTNWLRRNEAVPIIIDELDKLGYKTSRYVLYELPDSNRIILDVYNRDNDLGIVFNTGHFGSVKKEQRDIRTFKQDRFKTGGKLGRRETYDTLPDNIIVLQETWYWYQYKDDNSTDGLLNKTTTIEILRQDIRALVKEFENKK